MIFVTVGTQLPFDRLLSAMSLWAVQNPAQRIIAQTGKDDRRYPGLECHAHLDQREFRQTLEAADLVVSHAGMGTILMAAEAGKPIVILPRRADLGEHRNDHQRDTAAEMAALGNVHVVDEGHQLGATLTDLLITGGQGAQRGSDRAQPQLLQALKEFIWTERRQPARTRFRLRRVLP